ncbi:MAG: SAM-dependent methyltransferase [Candidatus Saccharibacteria bacterium]|nr:SAM-dependent methyltransferase [Candidatus Saccharibacteria bacterium]
MNIANAENKSRKFHHARGSETTAPTRGFLKISGAVKAFRYDFRGKTVLDIGSSTGGFTKLALDLGAKKVVAVEKGTNQMSAPLRFDPRVELHEKTDIFDFETSAADVIVADVSFLSLTKILSYAKNHLARKDTDFLVMLKPQFEASPGDLNRGVVKNESIRRRILKDFEFWLKQSGFVIIKKHDNELTGKTGNRERFYYLQLAK